MNSSRIEAAVAAVELAWSLPEDATVSSEQAAALRAFAGWGMLAPAFAHIPEGKWATIADRLDAAVPSAALGIASEQVDTSFYSPHQVTDTAYRLLSASGFNGGAVLEPGCGAGAFLANTPAGWDVQWTGVDVDPTATRIAALLNPDATVHTGKLEHTVLRDAHFDAVIGNVPFSSVRISDTEGRHGSLHNYFIGRAVEAVRPGGYIVLVTSRHTIDSDGGLFSDDGILGTDAAFIGAVRLPSGVFAEAGTDAVTDVIVLRRNDLTLTRAAYDGPADFETRRGTHQYWNGHYATERVDLRPEITTPDQVAPGVPARVSRYWESVPEHVAGQMRVTAFPRSPLVVRASDPATAIESAVNALAAIVPPLGPRVDRTDLDGVVLADADGRKEGSFHIIEGKILRVTNGQLAPSRGSAELTALIGLRDLAVALLDAESDTTRPDELIDPLRDETRAAYASYVSRFGHLNRGTLVEGKPDEETGIPALSWRRPALGGFRRDPDSALVMALEVYDQNTGDAGPAPILLSRVNRAPVPVESVGTPAEALAVSLAETGRVDLNRIASLLDLTNTDAAIDALGDLVYISGGRAVAAAEYLSGNVRAKYEAAVEAGEERNAAALQEALPANLGPTDIRITLGSPFVSSDDVEEFLRDVLGARWPKVERVRELGLWEVSDSTSGAAEQVEFGTADITPAKLVECGLNSRMPEITDRIWAGDRAVQRRNVEKSAAANEKLEMIRDRFSTWVWEDAERADRICEEYNRKLNSHVTRAYSGSGLTFPGLSAGVTPWAHQRAAVERITSSARVLIGHPVGAGKTLEMCMSAMTLRQFGLARKPMIVVPNHLLDQISREMQQAYPTAKLLIATKDDLARDARRLFAARCATGDWDAVIITHSSFTQIPVHPDTERDFLAEQKHDLRWLMQESGRDSRSKGAKAVARAIRALEARQAKLRKGVNDTDTIWFDQLGVDYLMIDEAHLFRRLDTGSTSRTNGFGSGSSKRASDLQVKIEAIAGRKPAGAPVVSLFTGTPWSNTLAETWVWQRYLQPDDLRGLDLLSFDAWVSAFVRYETAIEVAPDGSGFRLNRRPAGLVNVPELKTLLGQVADILDPDSLGLARPESTVRNLVVDPSPQQRQFVRDLAVRADAIRNKTASKIGDVDDNMLMVCNDGRKVALDPKLVGIGESSTKIAAVAEEIAAVYHEDRDRCFGTHPVPGGFQLAFLDLGTPKAGETSTYGRLRRAVVDRGIPAERVRFIHEATTDKARDALFAACRDGEVSLLIGSTSKVGMGTNVQTRLTDLWHIDAPWLPSDVIQRDGRGVRPGNLSEHVRITRVVTEGTFDSYTWQALERKSRSFDALYATGASAREVEDVSGSTMSYAEVKALASGNPLLLEQATVASEVRKLQLMRAIHNQSVRSAERTAKEMHTRAQQHTRLAEAAREATMDARELRDGEESALLRAIAAWFYPDPANGQSAYASRLIYRGLQLTGGPIIDGRRMSVEIESRYRHMALVSVYGKVRRRGGAAVAALVAGGVKDFIDDLPARANREDASAALCAQEASAARDAAEGAVWPDEGKLADAVARLARVDALIAADAAETAHTLAA